MSSIKVVLFDDNNSLRDSVAMLLKDTPDFKLVETFSNRIDIVEKIQQTLPDVVLMDIDMPDMKGIEGVRLIRKNFPAIEILMLTVFEDDEKIFAAIKAGAGGYVLKDATQKKLLSAIIEVCNGGAPMASIFARKVLKQLQHLQREELRDDYRLSGREKDVLSLLVQGLSYKVIGDKLHISYDTVRAHMKKIYDKLHVTSMTEAVAKAINKKIL